MNPGHGSRLGGQIREIRRQLGLGMGGGLRFSTELMDAGARPMPPVIDLRRSGAMEPAFRAGPEGGKTLEVRANGDTIPPLFAEAGVVEMLPPLPVLQTDTPVPLAQIGFETVGVSGHLWSRSLGFRLPRGWLIDMTDRAVLRLDFAHAGGIFPNEAAITRLVGAIFLEQNDERAVWPLERRW